MPGLRWELAADQAADLARTLFQEAGDALLVVEPGTEHVLDANPLAFKLTGLGPEDLQRLPVSELIHHEENAEDWLESVRRTMSFHSQDHFLLRVGQGEAWIPVSLSISRLHPPGLDPLALFTIRDRREQVAAYKRLQLTLGELRRVLMSVSDCLWSCRIDRHGRWRYRYLSPVVQNITGQPVGALVDDPHAWVELVAPEDRARWRSFRARIGGGQSSELEYRLQHADGRLVWVRENVIVSKPDTDGSHLLHGVLKDVSQRKQVERAHLERDLLEAQKLESLGVLAGGIAHDFNNLLTGIMGNASLARLTVPDNEELTDHLEQIETIAMRAADLCKQMLAYAGKARFVIEATDLNQLIVQTTDFLKVSISKKASLEFTLGQRLPTVLADATQIRQILMNLVINASEALGDREGRVRIATGKLEVRRDVSRSDFETIHEGSRSGVHSNVILPAHAAPDLPNGAYVFLEVSDDGCGMSEEVKSRIFEPFFTTKFTGRGLGLAAVLGIVRGHQGAIQVESEPGRGTTFRIFLPCNQEVQQRQRPITPPPPTWRGSGALLLVDDEDGVRRVAAAMVESLGYVVVPARDGEEAIARFHERRDDIRVVLLDLTMPRMDGQETFRELRKLDPDLPVVLMSGYSEHDARGRFPEDGPTGYLQKPFRLLELTSILRKATMPK